MVIQTRLRSICGAGILIGGPLCLLLAAGCNSPQETNSGAPPAPAPGGQMGGPRGGPGGGGRGAPVAENASGEEILQAKCGCHGPGGSGGRAPKLTDLSSRSDSELYTIIHDGKQKMPAFGSQLSEAQIKKVVTHLKSLKG